MTDTIFSKIINREIPADIVYEDDQCLAFRDINAQAPVHILLVPKKSLAMLTESTGDEQSLLGHLLLTAGKIAKDEGYGDAFRLVINNGENGPAESKEWFINYIKKYKKPSLGELGPVYGKQWRRWEAPRFYEGEEHIFNDDFVKIDQIANLIDGLKNNPSSRRHILSAWNVADVPNMGLPPCHVMSQYTIDDGKLWCHMYQRSCDMFLGVPFNVASYSLLTYMLAQVCGLEPGGFIHTLHDAHIYVNHLNAVKEQLTRKPNPLPRLELNPDVSNIDDFKYEDLKIVNYNPLPAIKAQLNVG